MLYKLRVVLQVLVAALPEIGQQYHRAHEFQNVHHLFLFRGHQLRRSDREQFEYLPHI